MRQYMPGRRTSQAKRDRPEGVGQRDAQDEPRSLGYPQLTCRGRLLE